MDSYIARQPIFNKKLDIYGYELLYRDTAQSTAFNFSDGDAATSETIMNSFHEIGIERITGGKRAFINFTRNLLLGGVATILPNKILVIELLENIRPSEDILNVCRQLHNRGYIIALDDFVLEPDFFPLISVADIVKIDFLETSIEKIQKFAALMQSKPIKLLAEKLETRDMFDKAKDMGFSLFQGYFFSKPVIVASEVKLSPLKSNCLQLIRLALEPNVNFTQISNIIKRDVALSYRLLRVVNSAFFGLRYTVKNIMQALTILGMDEVKKWITLISLAGIKDGKPDELIRISLIRARFLETIGAKIGMRSLDDIFMLGLLSLMDAIMDMPMHEIVKQTHISPNISESLLTGEGIYGDLLALIINYEKSEWDQSLALAKKYNIDSKEIFDIYLSSIEWSSKLL